jgi:uncharacterized LabA/DUF88 family protein
MKAIAYVDGFNLYYQAVKGTVYKWLDIPRACQMLVPEHSVVLVKYFTAPVGGKTDPDKPRRQQQYWRALKEIGCEIIQGKFMSRSAFMPLDDGSGRLVSVIKTEEKGSDVNLATHLLVDGFTKRYEVALVLSNDSDLAAPIRYVRDVLGLEIIVINPARMHASKTLRNCATSVRELRASTLSACQLPNTIHHAKGVIVKPATW